MYRSNKITVYFPCRNESLHLKEVLAKVPKFVDEIIIISNNSTDNTVETAAKLGVTVIEDNRVIGSIGYGFAHMSGIKAATGDIIIGADGDGTYPIEELSSILDHLIDNNLHFLSCNRHPLHAETQMPFKLRLGVWMLNFEVRILYGKNIKDILSGMWAIDRSIKDKLNLTMGDWNLSPEIKLNAALMPSINFSEYHIVQHIRHGESHQNYWKTGFSHLWWIFKHRLPYLKRTSSTS